MADIARQGRERLCQPTSSARGSGQRPGGGSATVHELCPGQKDYVNPRDNSTVTLPYGYQYNYVSNDRTQVILTNSPTFQPPVDPKTSWTVAGGQVAHCILDLPSRQYPANREVRLSYFISVNNARRDHFRRTLVAEGLSATPWSGVRHAAVGTRRPRARLQSIVASLPPSPG